MAVAVFFELSLSVALPLFSQYCLVLQTEFFQTFLEAI